MKHDIVFLKHIIDEVEFIDNTILGKDYESFMTDELAKRGCTRSLEIIGEAAKNVSDRLKTKHPDIDWRGMAGLRDRIIHSYFGINWTIIWDVLKNEVPAMGKKIKKIIEEDKNVQ